MPSHPDRVRRAGLPEGYQFGDAAMCQHGQEWALLVANYAALGVTLRQPARWRRPSENAGERLTSAAYRITQAQIAADTQ